MDSHKTFNNVPTRDFYFYTKVVNVQDEQIGMLNQYLSYEDMEYPEGCQTRRDL